LDPRTSFCVVLELVGVDPNKPSNDKNENLNIEKLTALAMMLSSQVIYVSDAENNKPF
jgi:hypothetical protein